jgi:hypothetical protein
VDAGGLESPSFRATWTPVDACGHHLEIYGSEGWVSNSESSLSPLRAYSAADAMLAFASPAVQSQTIDLCSR